jgi:hypothetical protein
MHFLAIVWAWLKALAAMPANLAKVATIDKQLQLQQDFSETKDRLEKAEKSLAKESAIKAGRMFFCNNAVWAKDVNGQIEQTPYCPRCFEWDGKAIHLITYPITLNSGATGLVGKCPECKTDQIRSRIPE